jgi:hypothetical protein
VRWGSGLGHGLLRGRVCLGQFVGDRRVAERVREQRCSPAIVRPPRGYVCVRRPDDRAGGDHHEVRPCSEKFERSPIGQPELDPIKTASHRREYRSAVAQWRPDGEGIAYLSRAKSSARRTIRDRSFARLTIGVKSSVKLAIVGVG